MGALMSDKTYPVTLRRRHQGVVDALEELQKPNGDTEILHSAADELVIQFIRSLGYDDIADAWQKVPKWYA